jgi:hypothetical protein
MKNKTNNIENEIEFDDNKIEHVLAGPDYGQPWGDWNGWEEIDDWCNEECRFEENITSIV